MFTDLENPIFLVQFVGELVDELRSATRSIKIYGGEAHDAVFDDLDFIDVIKHQALKGIDVSVVVSPVLMKGGDDDSPAILSLADQGLVKLYSRPFRGKHNHFRILDGAILEMQPWHEALLPLHSRQKHLKILRAEKPELFAEYEAEFARYELDENRHTPGDNRFLILNVEDLSLVLRWARRIGDDYDLLTREKIEHYLALAKESYSKHERQTLEKLADYLNNTWNSSYAR